MASGAAKERVLVVDDEPQVLVALEDLLSDRFIVYKTQSAEQALRVVEEERDLAVIVTDQRMPRMTGDELLAALSTRSNATRILFTGFADLSAVVRAVNEGRIFAYVTKPWDPEDLQLKVQTAAEHFRLAQELAHERQLLHDLMTNTPDGIYFKDTELRFRRANRSFAAMLDAPEPEQLVGKRISEIVLSVSANETETQEQRVLADGRPLLDIVREFRRGGQKRFLSETKAPIVNTDGRIVGLVGIARDVTHQRALEEQLAQTQKMEAIGRLAGGVAHDFNNLLSVIQSYAQMMLYQFDPQDPNREDLKEIVAAVERAAGLTRQLLAFSRRQVIEPAILGLNDVVSNIQKMIRRIIGEDVELVTSLSPNLGTVLADAGQVEQILVNLTVNARDAMPDGGKVVIETSNADLEEAYSSPHEVIHPGRYVVLAVTDTGTGMDPETQKLIFEPFFTTKEVGKGTGLGLTTVYGIVKQSSGHIVVYSDVGRGTSFKIYLPRADARTSVPPLRAEMSPAPAQVATILLVEDDDAVRRVAARILKGQGHTVLEARRPSEARILCRTAGKIDLLLTDVVMPDISGPTLVEELATAQPGLRALLMSGYPKAAVHETQLGGGHPYLEKPFTPVSLVEKVREVLGRRAPANN